MFILNRESFSKLSGSQAINVTKDLIRNPKSLTVESREFDVSKMNEVWCDIAQKSKSNSPLENIWEACELFYNIDKVEGSVPDKTKAYLYRSFKGVVSDICNKGNVSYYVEDALDRLVIEADRRLEEVRDRTMGSKKKYLGLSDTYYVA